ncbi:MAG: nicotinamide-nucleotide amidase [Lentisphaeria bacterium]|jgi:nicotinamide-nucleotide amidase
MNSKIKTLAARLGHILLQRNLKVTAAESCTGGGIGYAITSVPGSSAWFEAGYISYSNAMKTQLLKVKPEVLQEFGAVSEQVAIEMLNGALAVSGADIGIAVTGIAGPTGASDSKPVGLVWFAYGRSEQALTATFKFAGDRGMVRDQAVEKALSLMLELF